MKLAIVIFAVVAAASAQFPGQYKPGQYNPGQYNPFGQNYRKPLNYFSSTPAPIVSYAPTTFAPAQYAPTPAPKYTKYVDTAASANILKFDNTVEPDGSYAYAFETDNGIQVQEQGTPKALGGNPPVAPVVSQGSYSYPAPNGEIITVRYIADENGFQPESPYLPTPPPIPEAILRSLEFIARSGPAKL